MAGFGSLNFFKLYWSTGVSVGFFVCLFLESKDLLEMDEGKIFFSKNIMGNLPWKKDVTLSSFYIRRLKVSKFFFCSIYVWKWPENRVFILKKSYKVQGFCVRWWVPLGPLTTNAPTASQPTLWLHLGSANPLPTHWLIYKPN